MAVNSINNMRVHEVFDKVAGAKTKKEKIQILHQYDNRAIRDVLKGAFDDGIQFNLPEGDPPYNPASETAPGSSLLKQSKKFPQFVAAQGNEQATPKAEVIFIKLLESVHPEEAKITLWMKNKNLEGKYNGLTKKLAQEAFPGLITQ